MKKTIRYVLDVAASGAGMLKYFQTRAAQGITVLMYHRVLPDDISADYPESKLVIPQSAFERQVAWLTGHCSVLTAREAFLEGKGGDGGGRPRVCVTFDDGYRDNAEVAAPILERHGLRATFFVTTGFVATGALLWFDKAALHWIRTRDIIASVVTNTAHMGKEKPRDIDTFEDWMSFLKACAVPRRLAILARLDDIRPLQYDESAYTSMTVAQMKSLRSRGHEIGSHTVTHPILPQLSDDELCRELVDSRVALAEWLGTPVRGLCYPNGSHDDRVVAAARKAGYEYACTTRRGVNESGRDTMRLFRRAVFPASVTDPRQRPSDVAFRAEATGFHDWLRERCRGLTLRDRTRSEKKNA